MVSEKSGLHVNADNEVIGWVTKGSDVEMKEGDTLIVSAKTAQNRGLADVYAELKEQNKPAKVKKEGGRARIAVPTTGTYTVVKNDFAAGEACERQTIAQLLADNTSFADFWAKAPAKFTHVGRNGESKEFATSGFVGYCIRRGMISVDA